ncbi:transmembrane protein 214-B [Schistocerca nitens]|uniref:transmembrane protein 214-B n=1 Tax=Schistocerca nitens TaxID=7011 RepID=UPI00211803E5|nr:transmembrane protein 214-B [Schistocerca nitens]
MSGQWEFVGKTKQKANGQAVKKLSKNEKKKFVENAPKVEDILPLSQVKTLYSALDKENRKPQGKESVAVKENGEKKQPKKQPEKKKEAPKEKIAPPKNIEAAVKLIKADELDSEIKIGQARFAEAPLVWLKGLAIYCNSKLCVEHSPVFQGKPNEYPLSLLSGEVRELLRRAIKDAGEGVIQSYYEWCLTSMANDMTKGTSSGLGYKVVLQLLAFQSPLLTVTAIPKAMELMNSYQNRQSIGLSILWAIGLGGIKDFAAGVKVWKGVMSPFIEMRNYTNYVMGYAKDLFTRKAASRVVLSEDQFFSILDVAYNPKLNIPVSLRQECAVSLRKHVMDTDAEKRLPGMFQSLLERLVPSAHENLKSELCIYLSDCLQNQPESFTTWRQIYTKVLPQSALLLRHITRSWKFDPRNQTFKQLKQTLSAFQITNDELQSVKRKEDGLADCRKICTELQQKMTVKRSFPYGLGCLVLIAAIGALTAYDVKRHGTFKSSSTGLFLRDIGALKYGEQAWNNAVVFSGKSYQWAEENVPHYYAIASEKAKPAAELCWKGIVITMEYVTIWYENIRVYGEAASRIFIDWVNHYAPGLLEKLKEHSINVWNLTVYYTIAMWNCSLEYVNVALEWLRNTVFTGSLSPENIQKYSLEALNTTQIYALRTYDWVYQKVQTLSKTH